MTDILVTLALGTLSGMGVGGGGLFAVYMILVKGASQISAQSENLAFFLAASASALAVNLKKKRLDTRLCAVLALSGISGALPGARLAKVLPTDALRKIFGAALILVASYTVVKAVKRRRGGQSGF